jgi:phage repressor protein C with HTH and peptisase S24 domain
VGYTHRPPQLAYDIKAFATHAPADGSMAPCYKPGQYLMVSSVAPLLPGSGILVTLKDGHALVRELVEVSTKGVTVRSYAPKLKTVVIAAPLIEAMFRIVGAMDGTF